MDSTETLCLAARLGQADKGLTQDLWVRLTHPHKPLLRFFSLDLWRHIELQGWGGLDWDFHPRMLEASNICHVGTHLLPPNSGS